MTRNPVLSLFLLVAFVVSVAQAEVRYVRLPSSGKTTTINFPAGQKPSKLVFYMASPGNDTEKFNVSLEASSRVIGKLGYKLAKPKADVSQVVTQSTGWIPLKVFHSGKLRTQIDTGVTAGVNTSTSDPACGCVSEKTIKEILNYYKMFGQPMTREEYCKQVTVVSGPSVTCDGGVDPTATSSAYGIIEKNACADNLYAVALTVAFDSLSDAERAKEISITASMSFKPHANSVNSIFKNSDGEIYANQPIALLPFIVPIHGADKVEVITWKGTKIAKRIPLTKGDVLESMGYHRLLIGHLFDGRKAVFQVVAPFPGKVNYGEPEGYGRCFRLAPGRQEQP